MRSLPCAAASLVIAWCGCAATPDPGAAEDAGRRPDALAGTPDGPASAAADAAPAGDGGPAPAGARGYLHVEGSQLVDDEGRPARLTGVNWFGFETSNRAPHGLWSRDYRSMLAQMRALGFNSVRIPWSNAILEPGAQPGSISFTGTDAYDGATPINAGLDGKGALEVLDAIVEEAGRVGLRVILDNHSRKPDGYMGETLWYTADFGEDRWIQDWVTLAGRYRGDPVVVGFDLNNEPHGDARWAEGDASVDWRAAAERCGEAILRVNPDALIIVEGVEVHAGASYWWGGNLSGARDQAVRLSRPAKLVYSAHEYGPEVFAQTWFSSPTFPANMTAIWDEHFGFLVNEGIGHLLIGEFGIRDQAASGGKAFVWYQELMAYAGSRASWTFWCWNPNSGDTGGILQDDWVSVNEWKMDVLRPHLAPPLAP